MRPRAADAFVAVDASGTVFETRRQTGVLRGMQAGVIDSDYATLMVKILRDNAWPEAVDLYGAVGWAKFVGPVARGLRIAIQSASTPVSEPQCV
jgi:hypothetical protein